MSDCYDKALDLLSRRTHFRAELGAKLSRRDYDPEEIDEALDRLAGEDYLDDREAARQFVEERRQRNRWGRRRLRAELRKRGADRGAVDEVLAEVEAEDELELAHLDAERWLAGQRGEVDRGALARHLERKGFSSRVIVDILEAHGDELE